MFDSAGFGKFVSSTRVVHRLPGRVRIHIPILEKLPGRWLAYMEQLVELIKIRNGIEEVEIRPITGNLTIRYDSDRIKESAILTWLKILVKSFLHDGMPSVPVNEDDIRSRLAYVKDRVSRDDATQYSN